MSKSLTLSLSLSLSVWTGNDCGNENNIIVPSLNSTLEAGGWWVRWLVGYTGHNTTALDPSHRVYTGFKLQLLYGSWKVGVLVIQQE